MPSTSVKYSHVELSLWKQSKSETLKLQLLRSMPKEFPRGMFKPSTNFIHFLFSEYTMLFGIFLSMTDCLSIYMGGQNNGNTKKLRNRVCIGCVERTSVSNTLY
jgi:hypothetical protein